ncbi:DUF4157 domain-containing protein [Permianibacter aggregans]|nr:DUF4157 domain-containing protein [Permianibacter aggregans]
MPEKSAPQEPKEKPAAGPAVARKAGAAVQEREPAKANNVARKVGAPVKEKEPATTGNVARKSAAEVKQKEPASAANVARKEKPEVKERESGSPGNVARKAAEVKEKEAASAVKPARKEKAEVKEREASGAKPVARSGDGAPNVGANVQSDIERAMASGNPLPLSVRQFMEPRFNADFSNVKIHTDNKSASLSRQLSAQAFTVGNHIFFGRDRFQPEQSEGRELIAHELTHTIQQGAVTQARGVQRSAEPEVKERSEPKAQRLGISDALDYFADKAYNIPGYRMFTIVLGINPINMSRVDRSAANIMRAIVEFIPGGNLITRALDNHGVFDKVGNWVEQQIRSLGMTGAMIRDAVMEFLDSLGWRDIFDLGGVWNRAKRIFTEPIDRLINFAKGLINGILEFVKDAILRPLAELASQTRAWDLLIAVLGVNPITGDPVPRTADTLIGGFMKLIGQEEVWLNIKRGNAIARAWAWFQGALSGVMGFVRQIPSLFMQTLRSLTIVDLVTVVGAFNKVRAVFGGFAGQFISWAMGTVIQLLEILFSVVAPGAMPYIRRAAGAFQSILRNPIGFVGNLVRAARLGFQQFARNIGRHLRNSLIQWLTGAMAGAGLYIPQALTFQEIIKFVLSVMGLTWQNIRQKLVRAVGEAPVRAMETGFEIVRTLVTEGPAAAWQQIREGISNLQQMVIEQIRNFVVVRVVQAAITRLITSLNPAGAVIQAIIAIYNTIMFFIERMRQIAQVAGAFINSISAIASGAIGAAANRVEQTMAGLLTLVISFLARLVGLGRVSDAVTNIINRIRAPIDRALDRVVAWIVNMARRLGRFVAQAGVPQDPQTRLRLASQAAITAVRNFSGPVSAALLRPAFAAIKMRYGCESLDAFQRGGRWWVRVSINPVSEGDSGRATGDQSAGGDSDSGGDADMSRAQSAFNTRLFSRAELEGALSTSRSTALRRINSWKGAGRLHQLASTTFDPETLYSFDAAKAGQRDTNPNNRSKYGYSNPAKSSSVGLQVLSIGFLADRSRSPANLTSATYHQTYAWYRSVTTSTIFQYGRAILGHRPPGASGHWNRIGHTQPRDANTAWNRSLAAYHGPEEAGESSATGSASERYRVPSKEAGSHASWW